MREGKPFNTHIIERQTVAGHAESSKTGKISKIKEREAREMTQWLNRLLCEFEDWSSDFQTLQNVM